MLILNLKKITILSTDVQDLNTSNVDIKLNNFEKISQGLMKFKYI